jgi:MFS transporter, DHA2 family, multidrug resistance protein
MPIIGYLSNKIDPRILLTFGFFTFDLPTFYFGHMTLEISPSTLLIPILITGFSLSFVFVPINIAAYGTLAPKQIGNASGIYILFRNIGGSIGISVASTLLTRRSAAHQDEILNSVPSTGQQFQSHLQATLYQQLQRQASEWAFVDVFRWLSLLCFVSVVIVWLLKKVKPGKAPAEAH